MIGGIGQAVKDMWRIALPYYQSEERWSARLLLGAIVLIELFIVGITVRLNTWNADFYNALQDRNWDRFVSELIFFAWIVAVFLVAAVLQYVLNQWLQIRWRRWATERYLAQWLDGATHYRQKLMGDAADNPDQRIAEDVKLFIQHTLSIGIDILSSVVTLVSFVAILWGLSAASPLMIGGETWAIPGYLVWAALIYAVLGTLVAHWIGRKLIPLNFVQERYEANFRFALVRVRENAEEIALQRGEPAERTPLRARFADVMTNFVAMMNVQKWLVAFRAGYNQISNIFPIVVVSPSYFSGAIQLGALFQTSSAFDRVQGAFSIFVTIYTRIAEWKAVVDRLTGFEAAVAQASAAQGLGERIETIVGQGDTLEVSDLVTRLPGGRAIVALPKLSLRRGERRLVRGPSGTGKTTLLRGLSGVWPWGRGRVVVPEGTRLAILPQKAYLPLGTLRAAITYPAPPEAYTDAEVGAVLVALKLGAFAGDLDMEANWSARLSGGEQQRVALARAILAKPEWLLLDEATSALDPATEEAVLNALAAALPRTGILAISHRADTGVFAGVPVVLAAGQEGAPAVAT